MRNRYTALITAAAIAAAIAAASPQPPTIATAFSPRGGCAAATEAAIDAATRSVDVTAYQFTQKRLIAATIRARSRGLRVRVILDRSQETAPAAGPDAARRAAIELRTDAAEKLHHNKYVIIDETTIITGSYNWSDNAEQSNAENLVIVTDTATTAAFMADFSKHWAHSRPFSIHQPRRRTRSDPRDLSNPKPPPATKGSNSWHASTVPSIPTPRAEASPVPSPSAIGKETALTSASA
jgi:phosphatidylserine/phosphatidylglycerophosphate/cardiolipin synthase-like enzyme